MKKHLYEIEEKPFHIRLVSGVVYKAVAAAAVVVAAVASVAADAAVVSFDSRILFFCVQFVFCPLG